MRRSFLAAIVMMAALIPLVLAQQEEAPERRLDLKEIRDLRAQVENSTLTDESRTRALEFFDAALGALESAAGFERTKGAYERERAGVGRMVEELRASLATPDPDDLPWPKPPPT